MCRIYKTLDKLVKGRGCVTICIEEVRCGRRRNALYNFFSCQADQQSTHGGTMAEAAGIDIQKIILVKTTEWILFLARPKSCQVRRQKLRYYARLTPGHGHNFVGPLWLKINSSVVRTINNVSALKGFRCNIRCSACFANFLNHMPSLLHAM